MAPLSASAAFEPADLPSALMRWSGSCRGRGWDVWVCRLSSRLGSLLAHWAELGCLTCFESAGVFALLNSGLEAGSDLCTKRPSRLTFQSGGGVSQRLPPSFPPSARAAGWKDAAASFHSEGQTGSGSSLWCREAQAGCGACFWFAGRPLCSREQQDDLFSLSVLPCALPDGCSSAVSCWRAAAAREPQTASALFVLLYVAIKRAGFRI